MFYVGLSVLCGFVLRLLVIWRLDGLGLGLVGVCGLRVVLVADVAYLT